MSNSNYVIDKKRNPFFTIIKIIVIVIILVLMVGLNNSVDTNNLCFANIIGLDKSQTIPSNLEVTFQLITPKLKDGNSVSTENTLVKVIDENSLDLAVSDLQDYINSSIDFSNTNAIIISEDLAKEGVQRYISNISSNLKYNNNMYILICEGKAKDFIKCLDKNDNINSVSYFDILKNAQKNSASIKFINITEFSNLLFTSNSVPTAPICKVISENRDKNQQKEQESDEKNKENESSSKDDSNSSNSNKSNSSNKDESKIDIEVGGMAIFKDEKMIGKLSSDETAYYLMLTDYLDSYDTSLELNELSDKSQNNQSSFKNVEISQTGKAKIKVDTKNDKPRIDITIPLNIIILDTPAGEYNYLDSNYISEIKKEVTEILDKRMKDYINKTQNEFDADINEFYKYCRKNFFTVKEYESYNFEEKYKDAKVNVKLNISFNDSGLNIEK